MNSKKVLAGLLLLVFGYAQGYSSRVNLLTPYDSIVRPHYYNHSGWQLFVHAETGIADARGYDESEKTNVLRHIFPQQNTLAMLEGFDAQSSIGQLRTALGAVDDGTRGQVVFSGDLENEFSVALGTRYNWCGSGWSLSAYMPVYGYELKNVRFEDQTRTVTDDDVRVKSLLTDQLVDVAKDLGNLEISEWSRRGIGDVALLAEWHRDFEQRKDLLKKVGLTWRSGLLLPTGKLTDPDKLFAFPFGCDGAFALPFGLGIDVYLGYIFRAGIDVQLTHTFGTTKSRRIKTAENQTDLLLLQKVQAHKDYGLTQRFNLYSEFYNFFGGLSVLFGYQYIKHGDDELSLKTTSFSTELANSAEWLEEWTMHHVFIKGTYDFAVHLSSESYAFPQLAVLARLPFNGKRVAIIPSVGVTLGIDF